MNHEPWNTDLGPRWWFQMSFLFTLDPWGHDPKFDEHIFQMGWFNHQPVIGLWQDPYLMAYVWNDPPKLGTTPRKWTFWTPKVGGLEDELQFSIGWFLGSSRSFSGVFRRISSTGSFPANWELVNSGASCFFLPRGFIVFFVSFWLPSCRNVRVYPVFGSEPLPKVYILRI